MVRSSDDIGLYQPLKTNEIRLMRLQCDGTPAIKCSLSSFSIDKCPKYIALSYRWGTEEPSHRIHLDDYTMLVQSNLYDYLKLMKDEAQEDWTFIDYLCINQRNIIERGRQVDLMQQVYQRATEVIAWMGTKPDRWTTASNDTSLENIERGLSALEAIYTSRGSIATRPVIEHALARGLVSKEELFVAEDLSGDALIRIYIARKRSSSSQRFSLLKRRWNFEDRDHVHEKISELQSRSGSSDGVLEYFVPGKQSYRIEDSWNFVVQAHMKNQAEDIIGYAQPYGALSGIELEDAIKNSKLKVPDEYVLELAASKFPDDEIAFYRQAIISAFLQREYWTRVWIVQEIALSRVLTFRFRSLRLSSEDFHSFLSFYSDIEGFENLHWNPDCPQSRPIEMLFDALETGDSADEPTGTLQSLLVPLQLMPLRNYMHEHAGIVSPRTSLVAMILTCSAQKCSESFDHFFGILGITQSQLTPNYHLGRLELFVRVLAEGLVEQYSAHDIDNDWVRQILEAEFCYKLINNLDLDVGHPVVVLVVWLVWWKCERIFNLQKPTGVDLVNLVRHRHLAKKRSSRSKIAARLYTAAAFWRTGPCVCCSRAQDHYLNSPCLKLEARTRHEWLQWASRIFSDVYSKSSAA